MKKNGLSYFTNNSWILVEDNNKAKKIFKFKNFIEAFSWMTEIALSAEKLDHHPDWTNVYNTVTVILSTHDHGTITEKDSSLAKIMDNNFDKHNKKN